MSTASQEPQESPKPRHSRLGSMLGWLLLASALAVVSSVLTLPGCPLSSYELKTLDSRFHYRSDLRSPQHVAIVAIDDRSISDPRLGRWPWAREWHAQMLDRLATAGPRAVAFDVILSEPSGLADDGAFAAACGRAGNVYFGLHAGKLRSRNSGAGSPQTFTIEPGLLAHRAALLTADAVIPPLDAFCKVAAGGGAIVGVADHDGILRRCPLLVQERRPEGTFIYPTMLLALATRAQGLNYGDLQIDLMREARLAPGRTVPLDGHGQMLVNFLGPPDTIKTISFVDVLDNRFPAKDLKDKVVFVGFTAEGLLDQYSTPVGPKMMGVELQAQALESALQERFLRPAEFADTLGMALVLALAAAVIGVFMRPLVGLFGLALLVTAYNLLSLRAFSQEGVVWAGLGPNLALVVTFVIIAIFRLSTEEKARKRLRDEFGRYAPPQVVAKLDTGEMKVRAAGVKRPVTALFADVRGFTAWSAGADPQDVIKVLNLYFEAVTQLAFDVEGTIDNIVGDEIFVTFNAIQDQADHPRRAVDLAINMIAALDGLNDRWVSSGLIPEPMRIGVGIHTGEVLVGSLGSHIRTQYTALGQTINLASRLQSFNKELGTTILTTREVAEQLGDQIQTRNRGFHDIRGHPVPVEVYEVVGRRSGTVAEGEPSPAVPAAGG